MNTGTLRIQPEQRRGTYGTHRENSMHHLAPHILLSISGFLADESNGERLPT
jgi:hypothetical protein